MSIVVAFMVVDCSENSKEEETASEYIDSMEWPRLAYHEEYVIESFGSNTTTKGLPESDNFTIKQGVVYNDGVSENYDGWTFEADSGLVLYTEIYRGYYMIESWRDKVTLETADSIKCFRYNQAKDIVDQIELIDNIDCGPKKYLNLY